MNVLGISAYYHDSAAALVTDGKIVAAAQEERFTRKKHDAGFPEQAVRFCLESGGVGYEDLDYVVFYEKPLQKLDRLLETYLAFAPAGLNSFSKALPAWLKHKLFIKQDLKKRMHGRFRGRIVFPEHHESHAASAFFPSPFEEAAILTIDGVGEWTTASIGRGAGNKIEILKELRFPHSLGLLYSAFTYYAGFKVNSGEYKLMGLAPYGTPKYAELIKERVVEIKDDGSLRIDMSYFNYCQGLTMTSKKLHALLGGPPRKSDDTITQREMDVAASIQKVAEEAMLKMARHAKDLTGLDKLCLAGGVALNCVANGRILRERIFDDIWIQPAAGDAGGALGAALFCWHQLLEKDRTPEPGDSQCGSLLGPRFSDEQILEFLNEKRIEHERLEPDALIDRVAGCIADGKVIGWFQNRMEFGPRALGSRSIIGDARSESMQSTMNLKIKFRESFRPFAPCVLAEDAGDWFDLDRESPYMLLVAPVKERLRRKLTEKQSKEMKEDPDLSKRVNISRSDLPAITHVDYSARVQTVDEKRHGRFFDLIRRFKEKTGCPVIINTSFNIRGEPIVCTPSQAFDCFMGTEMDVLVLESFVVLKERQKEIDHADKLEYRRRFGQD